MSATPRLGPPPQRIDVGVGQVRRLVADQFPQWADRSVRPVAHGGWDNKTFHLGDDLLVRLPSAAEYSLAVEKEQRWLPVLAEQLPLPIPVPAGLGQPSLDFPFPWSIYRWIDGTPARADDIADPLRFAHDLADFLTALQAIDTTHGPGPGIHNWFRGGTVRTFEDLFHGALAGLADDGLCSLSRRDGSSGIGWLWTTPHGRGGADGHCGKLSLTAPDPSGVRTPPRLTRDASYARSVPNTPPTNSR